MSLEDLQKLPPEVKEVVFTSAISEYNQQISDRFYLNKDQLDFLLSLEEKIFLQKISSLDLPQELENMERAEFYDLRELSLDIAYKILWPLQDYLKDVDRLILRLGGKVPHLKHLRRRATMQNQTLPNYINGTVKELMKQYPDFKDLRLSSKKIIDRDGNLLSPTVDNWLNDYIKQMGAGYHSSLQRAKYLSSDKNVLSLTDSERESIRNFLVSYDDDVPSAIDNSDVIIKVKEWIEPASDKGKHSTKSMEEVLDELRDQVSRWQQKIVNEDLILSEAGNSLHKLRDILWQAIGIQDQDKVIGCLRVLLKKSALDLMLQEDKRFQAIIRRFISIRYNEKLAQQAINDKLLLRRLFFELLLSDKLNLSQAEATLAAFYLSSVQADSGQVVYLDLQDNSLKWRELKVAGNQLVWADQVD